MVLLIVSLSVIIGMGLKEKKELYQIVENCLLYTVIYSTLFWIGGKFIC